MFTARTLRASLPVVAVGFAVGALLIPLAQPASSDSIPATHGARVGQDPYLAPSGNGGIDVQNYDIELHYNPASHGIDQASLRLTITALHDLKLFTLDARPGLEVTSVKVNDQPARFEHQGRKLRINKFPRIESQEKFEVSIRYRGIPEPIRDQSGREKYGWLKTPGGSVTFTEPTGTSAWIPSNDIFYDKATWSVQLHTPKGKLGVSSGKFLGLEKRGDSVVTRWRQPVPIQPYTQVVAIDDFAYSTRPISGIPAFTAVAKRSDTTVAVMRTKTAAAIDWLTPRLGSYPFPSTGAIVVSGGASAMETAGRPVYSPESFYTSQSTVVHEQVHQWFGNTITAHRADDMWLHEGFATYLENVEHAERKGISLDDHVHGQYVYDGWSRGYHGQFDEVSLDDPSKRYLLNTTPYFRGQAALHALRAQLGDATFWNVLRILAQEPAGTTIDTPTLIKRAEDIAKTDLTSWANTWVYSLGYQQLPVAPSAKAMLRELGPGVLDAAGDFVWNPSGDPKSALEKAVKTYAPMNQLVISGVTAKSTGRKTMYYVDLNTKLGPLYPKSYASCFVFERNNNDLLAGSFLGVKLSQEFKQNAFTPKPCPAL